MESGKATHLLVGRYVNKRYLDLAKPSRGTALLRAIVSLNSPMNYTPLPTLQSMLLY